MPIHYNIPNTAKGINTLLYFNVFSMYIPSNPALKIPTNIMIAAR